MAGDTALARAGRQLARAFAAERRAVDPALADDDELGGAHARIGTEGVQHEGRAGLQRRAERRVQSARETAGCARAADARRVDGEGSGQGGKAPLKLGDVVVARALLRAEGGGSGGPGGLDVGEAGELGAAQAACVAERLEGAGATVDGGRAAAANEHQLGARIDGRGDQLARAERRCCQRVAIGLRHQPMPARARHIEHCGPRHAAPARRRVEQGELREHLVAERAKGAHLMHVAAERAAQHRSRALAAVGDRAPVGRDALSLEPFGDRVGDLLGRERALERVGRDQRGAGVVGARHRGR